MSCRLFPFFVVVLLAATGLSAEQAQDGTQPQKPSSTSKQTSQLKAIKSPTVPYPEEALRKKIEGKVILSIVVDAKGRVSEAMALSGPSELFQAALDSVKEWEFEPPTHAPVVARVEVSYGHPKECPGAVSDSGEVTTSGRLRSEKGMIVDVDSNAPWPLPPYSIEARKADVAGEMILSITVNAEGTVAKVHVVKSLSPDLDNAAIEAVRAWRFKPNDGNPDGLPDDFPVHIFFRPTCKMEF
jgi:TonB family protein